MDLIGRSCLGITFVLERLSVRRTLRRVDRMLREGCVRFQMVGVQSASPRIACGRMVLERVRSALAHALALYFAEPLKHCITDPSADSRFLDAVLNRGDVLFTEGNTRAAVLVKRLTRSRRSHVSVYVGPLDDGPNPLCVVEADIAAGVRPIRLSDIQARRLVVLRPTPLTDTDRQRLAEWVMARIGSDYDLAHAARLRRNALRSLVPRWFHSVRQTTAFTTTRFSCSSLLAHAFASIGYPLLVDDTRFARTVAGESNIVLRDFERATMFAIIRPSPLSL